MDEEDNTEYLLQLEKLMSSEIAATFWAPTMDILVIVTFDNLIEGYRISFKAQRFFHIEESQNISTLCYSPDSQFIAYSLADGSTKIIRTQNGERIITVENLGSQQVGSLNFVPFTILNPEEFMPFTKNSIQSKLILNISPHKNCNKNAIIKINYFNELSDNFTCLLQSQRHKVWLLLNGFVPIACLDYQKHLKLNPLTQEYRILHSHLNDQLYSIVAEEVEDTYNLVVHVFDAQALLRKKQDVVKYNCLISNITQILCFIETTYGVLESNIRDIIRQYNSKINLIDDSSFPDISPREELLKYLSIGLTSSTLMNFFTKEVYDTKHLQKLDETLTALFANLHDILIESVQNGLEKATLLLLRLLSYSEVEKYEELGVGSHEFKEIEEKLRRLYTLGEILLVESTETKFNIRNLLIWLNKASIKTSQENEAEIENTKSYLNKYTVDYTRLHKFLADDDTFRLQNLLKLFRKNDEKEMMEIPSPDFSMIPSSQSTIQPTQQQIDLFHQLEKELDLENIMVEKSVKMEDEHSYYSLKNEMKFLLNQWKEISSKPAERMGQKLSICKSKHLIGKVTITELFPFEPKFVVTDEKHLVMYYIDREQEQYDQIIKYDCTTQTRSLLCCEEYTIESIAVGRDIVAVFQEKMGEKKMVGQIGNEDFDGGQIMVGKKISNCDQGELEVDASMRGLNSLVIGKTKLVVFD